jgi:uncharacterized membrane-anchored protein YitT (DUF2179 family)
MTKLTTLFTFSSFFQMIAGIALAVFALRGFMIPNHFLDGGVIGISILLYELADFNLSLCLILGNIGFIILAYKRVSKEVAIKSFIAVILIAIGLEFIEIPAITTNKVLISIFGGAILGTGVGLVIRSGGALDGTEILVVLTRQRIGLSMSEVIMVINSLIFLTAAIFLGIETAMFSIITYFTATKMIDYVVDGVDQFTALTIISSRSEEIKTLIVQDFSKGITVYKGERGFLPGEYYTSVECDIIITIVTRLELLNIKKAVFKADPHAFVFVQTIREASGGVLSKQAAH